LIAEAAKARRKVSTLAIDTGVRFATAADRAAFGERLTAAVAELVSEFHNGSTEGGREHRVIVAVHPRVDPTIETASTTVAKTTSTEES
jgi:hypothetical protein